MRRLLPALVAAGLFAAPAPDDPGAGAGAHADDNRQKSPYLLVL